MVTEQLTIAVENFLKEKFSFLRFEIYNYFENDKIYYNGSKARIFENMDYEDKDAFEMIETIRSHNWQVYNDKISLRYIAGEFRLFSYLYTSEKFKITDVKNIIEEILNRDNFVQTIKFNPIIKDLIKEGRHRIKNTYPEDRKDREKITANLGDKVYISNESTQIANPAYVIEDCGYDRIRIAYFTSISKDRRENNDLKINGWAVRGVSLYELGLNTKQAIKNQSLN